MLRRSIKAPILIIGLLVPRDCRLLGASNFRDLFLTKAASFAKRNKLRRNTRRCFR